MRPAASVVRDVLAGALVMSGALIAVPAAAAPAQVSTEDAPAPSVRVVVDTFGPLLPGPDDTIRIRGRLISTARTELTDVSVQVRRSTSPLEARKQVTQISESAMSPETGDPDRQVLYSTRTVVADTLPPGGRRSFSLRIPASQLGLTSAGTYVLGIEAIGRESGVDEFDTRKGILRTFLPWYPPGSEITPIDLVWLWPLADWPARTADGILLDNQTPTALSDGGRLANLLAVGSKHRSTVSWIADPALLQTASVMTRGYQVQQDGTVFIGDREEQAQAWLTGLAAATRTTGMRSLPYADVDASAVTRADMSNDVVRSVTQGPGIATAAVGAPVPGDLYWAPFGRIDRPSLNVLASAGVTDLVLSADAMPPTDESQSTEGLATAVLPTSVGSMRVVLTDPGLTRTLGLPQRGASDVIVARQRFLAETALIAETLPDGQSARSVVAAPDSVRWSATASLVSPLLRATRNAPWLSPLTLAELLDSPPPSTSRERGGYGEKARDAELDAAYMARVARVSDQLDTFTSVIDNPTGISEPFAEALLRSESSAWRNEVQTGNALVASIGAQLVEETARVRVLSEGTITFSGDTGRVPVTITNDLDRSVTVGLVLRARPALRLSSEPLTQIRIDAGRMTSVDIDARVIGGGPLTVDVQLLGPDGQSYGSPATITVTSTAYARAAAYVVAAAFVAILVFVVVGVIRRIRKAQASRSSSDLGA